MATYVCSDIHGHYDTWLIALNKSGIQLDKGDNLIILGDLIDRGKKSLECINFALNLVDKYPEQVTYLMGNHEKLFLDFINIKDPKSHEGYLKLISNGKNWLWNGGVDCVQSFLGEIPDNLLDIHELINKKHSELIKKLNKLPYHKIDFELNCVFVHAGFKSNIPLKDQNKHDMIWIREDFFKSFQPAKNDILEGKLIVHGHTPVQYFPDYIGEGYYRGKHHICIDGGSAMGNNILIVKINDWSYVSENILQIN